MGEMSSDLSSHWCQQALPSCDRSHSQMEGTQLGLTHSCTWSSTFAFYYASLGWKYWGPRSAWKNTRILLLCLIHGDAGSWPQMCWPRLSPTPAGAQAFSLHLFSVAAQNYFEFFTLSCSLNHLAYSHFGFLQHLCESSPNSFHPFFPISTFLADLYFYVSFLSFFLLIQQFFLVAFPIFLFSVLLTFENTLSCWYKPFWYSELFITCHPQLLKSFLLHWQHNDSLFQILSVVFYIMEVRAEPAGDVLPQHCTADHRHALSLPPNAPQVLGWPKLACKSRAADLASHVSLPTTQGASSSETSPLLSAPLLNSGALS